MPYSANKKISGLDQFTPPLNDNDKVVIEQQASGRAVWASLTSLIAKVFDSVSTTFTTNTSDRALILRPQQGGGFSVGTTSVSSLVPSTSVTNSMLVGNITDDKLQTISTAGKVTDSATSATPGFNENGTAYDSANNGKIVKRNGSGNFAAGTITATLSGNASTATNLGRSNASYPALPYQSGANTTSLLGPGTAGQFLKSNGPNGTPEWSTFTTTSASADNLNLPGALQGAIVYQNSATTTVALNPVNAGGVVTYTGQAQNPVGWTDTSSSSAVNTLVKRDNSGNFSGATISATTGFSGGSFTGTSITGTSVSAGIGTVSGGAATFSGALSAASASVSGALSAGATTVNGSLLTVTNLSGASPDRVVFFAGNHVGTGAASSGFYLGDFTGNVASGNVGFIYDRSNGISTFYARSNSTSYLPVLTINSSGNVQLGSAGGTSILSANPSGGNPLVFRAGNLSSLTVKSSGVVHAGTECGGAAGGYQNFLVGGPAGGSGGLIALGEGNSFTRFWHYTGVGYGGVAHAAINTSLQLRLYANTIYANTSIDATNYLKNGVQLYTVNETLLDTNGLEAPTNVPFNRLPAFNGNTTSISVIADNVAKIIVALRAHGLVA